ncbi:hypothetical protein HY988_00950 [Candidatus Micrarchaeota archaeon]|nr:hypothetical protein [Candidatus Micrarchaeota archaeon]
MRLSGSFFEFSQRLISAAKKGGLSPNDSKKLDRLLTRTAKRNTILAKGILAALSAGGASTQDVARFGQLLLKAEERIAADKKPFTESESRQLGDLFQKSYVSTKTAKWFSGQIDELVAGEINDFISGNRKVNPLVPSRKTVGFEKHEEKHDERKKLKE